MKKRITIRRPDDWHLHVRDGAMLAAVLPCTARHFARAIIMPNLVPPVVTAADAIAYRTRILAALPEGAAFTPLMTCYLTDTTDPDDLERGFRGGVFAAAKLYPAHATTNSASGVTDIAKAYPVFARMEKIGMPLLMHGEDVADDVDVFDRERVFIDRTLLPLLTAFPGLRMVLEHLSTKEAVEVVRSAAPQLAGTITPHHLTETRTDMLGAGLRPDLYCMPVIKTAADRAALRAAATSGEACFFLGTDSAPHQVARKVCSRLLGRCVQCAGCACDLCAGVRRGERARPAGGVRLLERPEALPPAAEREHDNARMHALDGAGPRRRRRRRGAGHRLSRRGDPALAGRERMSL